MSRVVLEGPQPKSKPRAVQSIAAPSPKAKGFIKHLWWPVSLALALATAPVLFQRLSEPWQLAGSVWAASAALLIFASALAWQAARANRNFSCQLVLNPVHYVQLCMHLSINAYWGWYWREVYRYLPLIGVQLVFAYALDMLLSWARRDKWIAGFGPFPIILSTNLFLWFRDEYFYLQFLLIATGVLGKEFVRWKRDGRSMHIFNPSALSLFLFSVALIATKSTGTTWGIEIANTLHRPPHIYLEIFLLGLIVQALFRVTLVTLFSVVALLILNFTYTYWTGSYNFIDSNIPVAVFLGLHLLVTDPATSPRKDFGKVVFGLLYGAGVFGIYRLLVLLNAPEFYDKLLCVPLLNLSVRRLDWTADWLGRRFKSIAWWNSLPSIKVNRAWMSVWIVLFCVLSATGFLSKGKDHPGGDPEFWHRACQQHKPGSCAIWVRTLNAMCESNSAPACLRLGEVLENDQVVARDPARAGVSLGRACDLNSAEGCASLLAFVRGGGDKRLNQSCQKGDGAACFLLGTLYSAGKGVPANAQTAFDLFRKSCDSGWGRGCGRLGVSYQVGQGTEADPQKAIENFDKGCNRENAASCYQAAEMYWQGEGVPHDPKFALKRLDQACGLGLSEACQQRSKLSR